MAWILLGIFVTDMTFYFRIIDVYPSHTECLYAGEAIVQDIGKPLRNYNVVCVPVDEIKGQVL
tara:strand:- start:6706 stop:6894 length:189 start_codon:yes stop_codon:yes gene_type:complete